MKDRVDLIASAVVVAVIAVALWEARDWVFRTKLFPWAIGFPVLALAVAQLVLASRTLARATRSGPREVAEAEKDWRKRLEAGEFGPKLEPRVVRARTAQILFWTLFFFAAIWLLNFKWAALVATLVFLKIAAREQWTISLVLSLATFAVFHLVFDQLLHIPFGRGLAFELLGLEPPL